MAKGSGGTRNASVETKEALYQKAKQARKEALEIADALRGKPAVFNIENGIYMKVEVSKQDIKTLTGKNLTDEKFNLMKNEAAKDIKGFLEKATYEGWSEVHEGKHPESAYFVYYSKTERRKIVLCVRKIKKTGVYKPYAFYTPNALNKEGIKIKKGTPL